MLPKPNYLIQTYTYDSSASVKARHMGGPADYAITNIRLLVYGLLL